MCYIEVVISNNFSDNSLITEECELQVKKIYLELVMNGKPKSRYESDLEIYFKNNNLRQFEVKIEEFF